MILEFDWARPSDEPVAVAVSGGADSFALLHALNERGVPVVALTVDHRLRPEAAAEAATVATWCAERGIPHETLTWRERPERNLQAAARTARYRLLCQACNRLGIGTLAAGHTADDQAETVFMRLRRGSGRGLAAMPKERLIAGGAGDPLTLDRPLLCVRRAETQAYAAAHGLPVCEDPSNDDEQYERVRIRALLGALEEQDLLTVEALCRTAETLGRIAESHRGVIDQRIGTGDLTADGAAIFPDRKAFDDPLGGEAAARLLSAVSGTPDMVPGESALYRRARPFTEGGALVAAHGSSGWVFLREPAALLGRADGAGGFDPIPVAPGEKHLYDGRFIVHVPAALDAGMGVEPAVLRPLGQLLPRDIATSTLDRKRLSTLPCLSRGDRLMHLPAQCVTLVQKALARWNQSEAFLASTNTLEASSLLEERFSGRIIRF